MKFLPASDRALRWLNQTTSVDLAADLELFAASIVKLVPSCVGISLTITDQDLTFTLLASAQDTAALAQAHSPVPSRALPRRRPKGPEVLDESLWLADSLSTAAPGVRSTLTLPVTSRGQLNGTIQVYAADPVAFVAITPALVLLTGAHAGRPITNFDLAFTSRQRAEHAPAVLKGGAVINQAIGRLIDAHHIDAGAARSRLYDAAAREGVDVLAIARAVADGHVDRA